MFKSVDVVGIAFVGDFRHSFALCKKIPQNRITLGWGNVGSIENHINSWGVAIIAKVIHEVGLHWRGASLWEYSFWLALMAADLMVVLVEHLIGFP